MPTWCFHCVAAGGESCSSSRGLCIHLVKDLRNITGSDVMCEHVSRTFLLRFRIFYSFFHFCYFTFPLFTYYYFLYLTSICSSNSSFGIEFFLIFIWIFAQFYVFLTVHPGTTLGKWPTWCTIALYKTFIIIILYMFRATLCSSSGGRIVLIQHLL